MTTNAKNPRTFKTGATRDTDQGKLDFEGFYSPLVVERFGKYMHKNRTLRDGSLRDSDNWQKGIPVSVYMKSLWRHFFYAWKSYRGRLNNEEQQENLCAILFNAQGMLHELLKEKELYRDLAPKPTRVKNSTLFARLEKKSRPSIIKRGVVHHHD